MSSRAGIHYWKCDRPAALFGTLRGEGERGPDAVRRALEAVLPRHLAGADARLETAGGQGNHLTFRFAGERRYFVRVEDGPERDDYLEVESALLGALAQARIPVPAVHAGDATRAQVPFAWHVLDDVGAPDLNTHFKAGTLDAPAVFADIGRWIARWQSRVPVAGFGPFDLAQWRAGRGFRGLHADAAGYFFLQFERHLGYLVEHGFLDAAEAARIARLAALRHAALAPAGPVLVHKDMALWNVLGEPDRVAAFIDWDDAIGGDPLEDLALLGCFHTTAAVEAARQAYATERALPADWAPRFWLHLVRNLVVKAVIRVGAGYFDRADGLFLLGAGGGAALREFTLERLRCAVDALERDSDAVDFGA